MRSEFLIDGYNLLHALGMVRPNAGPRALEKARRRMLHFVADQHAAHLGSVTVIFDASRPAPGAKAAANVRGIEVIYAVRHDEADDWIEERIRRHTGPRRLTVVSNDRRLHRAAQRGRCQALECDAYLDWLEQQQERAASAAEESKQEEPPSAQEIQDWIEEFADLNDDPAMKELFDPFGFNDKP